MTESRIPEDLANRVWLTLAYHPGASGPHCMQAALDAHLDELAALVQPDAHVCDSGDFDRTVCGCGAMHSYCGTCGKRADECNLDAQAEPSPDALPRPITREEMRPGQVVEERSRWDVVPDATANHLQGRGAATFYLIEDAPNPDAALIDALAWAIAADDGRPLEDCDEEAQEEYRGNARAVLAVLRERCDITPRGEQ